MNGMTITLPDDLAALVKRAVEAGEYASTSELIREALRDWQVKAEERRRRLPALRRDIDEGMADVVAGRLVAADIDDIMEAGRRLSAKRARSVRRRALVPTSLRLPPISRPKRRQPSRAAL